MTAAVTEVATEPTIITDDDLVQRAQAGNRQAYAELIRRHRLGVVNVVYRMCGDALLAEDAAQETFIRAWSHLASYQPQAGRGERSSHGFRNWLYRIATNHAINLLRRERTTVDIDALPLSSDPARGPEARVERRERAEAVRRAVLALPDASRSALILREYEGLSYKDIAETLDIPIGTVMSRLSYARQWLRAALASYMEATS